VDIVQINFAFDSGVGEPAELLARYSTLTGWSEAVAAAGAGRVSVVQRFHRDAQLSRNGVDYLFVRDGAGSRARPWRFPSALRRAIIGAHADIVHVNGLNFPVQTWRLRRALPASAAIVVQDHGGIHLKDGRWPHRFTLPCTVRRRAMQAADGFLFVAPEHADEWRRIGCIGAQQIYQVLEASKRVMPMPREEARRISGMAGKPAVLWVGRLDANKDPLTVLDGFEQALARLPEAFLTMIYSTTGLLSAVRERLLASPTLGEHVRLVGSVPHGSIAAFHSAADLFVLGSHYEAGGYAVIEALACGTPPVVTDIPTFRVATDEGSLGALWKPGDAAGFARALVEVSRQNQAALRARIAEHFDRVLSWPAVGRRAMAIYREVLSRRRTLRLSSPES
jgi:glycosyltransferase involved in cell wall biosynthesis